MADHVIETHLEQREGTAGRVSGDPMTPEGAKARLSPAGRTKGAITGAPLVPEGTSGPKTGNAMDNTQKSAFIPKVIVGPMVDEPRISGLAK